MKVSRGSNWAWEASTTMCLTPICQVLRTIDICSAYYTTYIYYTGAHRALGDVQAMKAVFTHPSLKNCLSKLQIRSPKQQLKSWVDQKALNQRTTSLISSLGKPAITAPQAKRLDTLGVSHAGLVKLRSEAKDSDDFSMRLKAKGVNSKPLRAKLAKLLGFRA